MFEVYLKDSNKRAKNIKLALIFFTASEVYVQSLFQRYTNSFNYKNRENVLFNKSKIRALQCETFVKREASVLNRRKIEGNFTHMSPI